MKRRDPEVQRLLDKLAQLQTRFESEDDDAITAYYGVSGMVADLHNQTERRTLMDLLHRAQKVGDKDAEGTALGGLEKWLP